VCSFFVYRLIAACTSQVWLHGTLIGGVDVCEEMVSAGQTLDLKYK
jgi:glutaredoxin-related protein